MTDRKCSFCGAPDARHRVLDSIVEGCLAGDLVFSVALDYEVSKNVVYDLVTAVLSDRLGRARGNERKDKGGLSLSHRVSRE